MTGVDVLEALGGVAARTVSEQIGGQWDFPSPAAPADDA